MTSRGTCHVHLGTRTNIWNLKRVIVKIKLVWHGTVQYSTVQYSTVQFSTVQHSTVQCSIVYYT